MSGLTLTDIQFALAGKIDEFICARGGDYPRWCVGITSDPQTRLKAHRVSSPDCIIQETPSESDARSVEAYFKDFHGTAGDKGGGDRASRFVYAFKVTDTTSPCLAEL